MSKRNSMTTLTRWVLGHKKLVVGLWLVLAIGGFAAIKPAGDALSTSFNIPVARPSLPTAASRGSTATVVTSLPSSLL